MTFNVPERPSPLYQKWSAPNEMTLTRVVFQTVPRSRHGGTWTALRSGEEERVPPAHQQIPERRDSRPARHLHPRICRHVPRSTNPTQVYNSRILSLTIFYW